MIIQIEQNKCIGCGTCAALCPACFELANDGKAVAKQIEIEETSCAREASECCPAQCINIK